MGIMQDIFDASFVGQRLNNVRNKRRMQEIFEEDRAKANKTLDEMVPAPSKNPELVNAIFSQAGELNPADVQALDRNREFPTQYSGLNLDQLKGVTNAKKDLAMADAYTAKQTPQNKKVMSRENALELGEVPEGTEIIDEREDKSSPDYIAKKVEAMEKAKQMAKMPMARNIAKSMKSNLMKMRKEAEDIMNDPDLESSTGMSAMKGNIPGTAARRIAARLLTLKAKTGFETLRTMREQSKTGGALGNTSEKEIDLLQNSITALDQYQNTPDFKNALQRLIDDVDGSIKSTDEAFFETYGQLPDGSSGGVAVPQVGGTFNGKPVLKVRKVR